MSWSTRAERCWSVGLTSWSRAACEVTGVTSSASAQAGFTAAWLSAASTARWSLEHRQQSNRQTGQHHAQNGYAPSFRMVRRRSLTLTGTNTTADTVRSASAKAMDGDLCGSMGGLAASSPKPLLRDSSVVSNRSFTAPTGTKASTGSSTPSNNIGLVRGRKHQDRIRHGHSFAWQELGLMTGIIRATITQSKKFVPLLLSRYLAKFDIIHILLINGILSYSCCSCKHIPCDLFPRESNHR